VCAEGVRDFLCCMIDPPIGVLKLMRNSKNPGNYLW
jgi:hypothetical protein